MQQLNMLPINVSKNIDMVDESYASTNTKNNDDFSQLIDQHLDNSPENTHDPLNENHNSDKAGSAKPADKDEDLTSEQASAIQSGQTNDISNNQRQSHDGQILEKKQQEVAASGKNGQTATANSAEEQALLASEQLMSFLYKADNTLLAEPDQSGKQSDQQVAPLSIEQKALYEAQLLLNSSNLVADLSGVAKALSTEQLEHELAQNITDKKQLLSTYALPPVMDKGTVKLPVEPIIQGELQAVIEIDTPEQILDATGDLALPTNKKDQKQISADLIPMVTSLKTNTENIPQTELSKDIDVNTAFDNKSSTNDLVGASKVNNINTTVQNVTEQEESIQNSSLRNSNADKSTVDVVSQFESTQSAFNKKIAELAQAKQTSLEQSKQVATKEPLQVSVNPVDLNSNSNSNSKINDIISKGVSDRVSSQLGTQEGNKHVTDQNVEQTNNQKVVAIRGNQSTQTTHVINAITEQQQSKIQGQKSLEEVEQKAVQEVRQESLSLKVKSQISEDVVVEEKISPPLKTGFSANAAFTDVSTKATLAAQQSLEQQSVDMLNPTITSEVTQSQKTNTQLHQETIAIFRKDFADAVKDKVMLMISQKLQQFDINLDPPELGNMQVRVNLQSEQAVVNFMVQNQQAKEALEQNMHKLRDMLAQQGVDVGDANVEQQSQQSDNDDYAEGSTQQQGENIAQANDLVEHTLSANMINSALNAVDYYA